MAGILEQPFYHNTIRTITAAFGSVFNDLRIQRQDGKIIRVPLAYAAQQKYNMRMDQDEDPHLLRFMKRTPRMSFVLTGWRRDPSRVKNRMHRLKQVGPDSTTSQYNRVPYTFTYRLEVTARYMDDLLQIFEQIAVMFNPAIQVVIKDNPDLDEDSSININLDSSQATDSYEGIYENMRETTATFEFSVDGYLYMPTSEAGVIKTVYVNYFDLDDPLNKIDDQVFDEDDAL